MKKSLADFLAMDLVSFFETMEEATVAAATLKAELPTLLLVKGYHEKNFSFVTSAIKRAKISDRSKKAFTAVAEKTASALAYGRLTVDTSGRINKYAIEMENFQPDGKFPKVDDGVLSQLERIYNVIDITGAMPSIKFINVITENDIRNRLEKLQVLAQKNGFTFDIPSLEKLEII